MFLKAIPVFFFVLSIALATFSQTAAEVCKRAQTASEAKNYPLAIEEYTACIGLDPKNSLAYFNRGFARARMKQLDLAIADYTKAIELKPGSVLAYINRGNAYAELEYFDPALADYSKAIEADPAMASTYYNRGYTYQRKARYSEALEDYNKAIALDTAYEKAYVGRGNVYSALEKWDAAIADFDRAIELNTSNARLLYPNALMSLHAGKNDAAFRYAEKFLERNGPATDRSAWVMVTAYLALLKQNKPQDAESFVGRYELEKMPGVMPAKALGFLRGKVTEAELLAEAGQDAEKQADARFILGQRALIDGAPDRAKAHFTWVKENGRKNPGFYTLAVIELQRLTK